jgi:anthranilate phosphoribosyltransferase
MWKSFLERLENGLNLETHEISSIMETILRGEAEVAEIKSFLVALKNKGETAEEVSALVNQMFAHSAPISISDRAVDTVGTGGDGAHTFNISTASMFVAAAAGARVAKHGGRSVSSASGSADALEALGVNINLKPAQVAQTIAEIGIGFMFAPNHHAAMKHAAPVRKELGVRTVFNILGPLTNPAGAPNIMMGVFHPDLVGIQARVLQQLGAKHAVVVWARDNMDEVSLGAATMVGELVDGEIREYEIHPEDFGLQMSSSRNLKVASAAESIAKIREVLDNQAGPARDIVLLNSGTALYTAGVASSIAEGVDRAREAVASGAARAKLEQFAKLTRTLTSA